MVHGETIFSDMSATEFNAMLNSHPVQSRFSEATPHRDIKPFFQSNNAVESLEPRYSEKSVRLESPVDASRTVDWSTGSKIYVSAVKDQIPFLTLFRLLFIIFTDKTNEKIMVSTFTK